MKIISGGQTGADRAALDAAIALGLDYGGSIPKGRKAEDGEIYLKYDKLTELESEDYIVRTEKNVIDSDATLVFTECEINGGTLSTINLLKNHKKPFYIIDFRYIDDSKAIEQIKKWLLDIRPQILNIAGPRESKCPGIYKRVFTVLKKLLKN